MNWELFRRANRTIDLKAAYVHLYPTIKYVGNEEKYVGVCRYFERIQELEPIKSRQAAALAISTAKEIIG